MMRLFRRGWIAALVAVAMASCGGGTQQVTPAGPAPVQPESPPPAEPVVAKPLPPAEPEPPELVFPDEEFRAQRPTVAATRPFKQPKVERFKLANGIEVYLVARHELPTVTMDLVFDGGSVNDPKGKEGLARQCVALMSEGTEKLDKVAFSEALADMASGVNAWAGRDQQGVTVSSLSRFLDPTLDLWADVLLRPGMRQADFERMRAQAKATVKQQKGAPTTVAQRVFGSVLFGEEHPFGRVLTEASLDALTLDDCKAYVAAYIKPQGARLYVVGDITRKQIEEKVGARLGGWKGKPRASAKLPKPAARQGRIFFVHVANAPQSQIYVMHLGPERKAPDYFANTVMASILGGSFSSRINTNIREDKGWAYGAYGVFRYTRHFGWFLASASVRTDVTKEAIVEIVKEMDGMITGDISDEELQREIKGAILSLPGQFATGMQTLGSFRELVYYGLPLNWYETYVQNVQKVTKDLVKKSARAHLKPRDVVVLVVGDAAKVRPKLDELLTSGVLGPGELVVLDADGKVVQP